MPKCNFGQSAQWAIARTRRLALGQNARRGVGFAVCALVVSCAVSSAATASARVAKAAPVKLGFFVNLTGTDSQYPDALAGAKAAVRGINATGGINGHKVVLDWCDVQSNVNVAEACARNFVSAHVVASVGNNDNYGPQQTAILQSAKIPDIADESLAASSQFSSPIEFPTSSAALGLFAAGDYYGLKIAHETSFAFVGLQIPEVAALAASVESTVKAHGGKWAANIAMPASTTSFAPYAASAASSGAQVVYLGMSGPQAAEFAASSESAGYNFHAFVTATAYTQQTLESLGPNTSFAKKMYFASDIPPASAAKEFPLLKTYASNMAAEAKSGDTFAGPKYQSIAREEAWYAFHAAYVIGSMIKRRITTASMLKELRTAKHVQLGLQPAWTPSAKGPKGFARINSWNEYMLKIQNGKLVLAYSKSFNVESFVAG